ncbi:Sec-independent protein translocase protein TatB [Teredinibacter sp. KSP-S5-2]|uniref:Sec-independent protein translocase protein TatB n=1 Tax=Teredinibacter sp. KSP-S5-2 TaxID=3034506 RepID=UPI0029350EA9|nr:Sec-independent protein translocase protein TatB [Teredinibacter sp. KSP-S5-2]WNO08738.1 Sec-independent protein translocase protein TatB [Teredinibacter sp. KSP-S5-2]
MFDIGFLELLVIAVVGLLVVGPERLPDTVKTCARWVGRIKRVLRNAREEFEQQIGADEIRREIHNEEVLRRLQELKDTKQEIEQQFEPPLRHSPIDDDEEEFEAVHPSHNTQHAQDNNEHSDTPNKT